MDCGSVCNAGFSSLHTPESCSKEQGLSSVGCVFFGTMVPAQQLHIWGTVLGCTEMVQATFSTWICPQNYSW